MCFIRAKIKSHQSKIVLMIEEQKKRIIEVPCKNKITEDTVTYEILAYDFSEAKEIVEDMVGLDWIVGYSAM